MTPVGDSCVSMHLILFRFSIFIRDEMPHFMLMQPQRVGISQQKLVSVQSVDGRRALYPDLFAVDEYDGEFLLSIRLRRS
jgi:hypothetical protein